MRAQGFPRLDQMSSLPAKLWAYTRKGEIYYQQGKVEQAIQVWTRGKALEPPHLSKDSDVPSKWLEKVQRERGKN